MKLRNDDLADLIKKAMLGGAIDVEMGCIFDFGPKGIRAIVADRPGILFADILLKKEAIKDYEAGIQIGIKDIEYLGKIVAKFKDEVEISVVENKLRITSPTKIGNVTLAAINTIYVSDIQVGPDGVSNIKLQAIPFHTDSSQLKNLTYKLKELAEDTIIMFATRNGAIDVTTKFNTDSIIETIPAPDIVEKKTATFSIENLEKITKSLTSDRVIMYIGTDVPVIIEESDAIFDVSYVLAPRVGD